MKQLKTISGQLINVSVNHSNRTFTLCTNGSKYRTNKMSKEDFNSCLSNTGNDWKSFFNYSNDYFVVK